MDAFNWIVTIVGFAAVIAVLIDVFFAVLHVDIEGAIAPSLHRLIWCLTLLGARWMPRYRRHVLALAGPTMIVLTSIAWMGLFIFGFACIYWPHLNAGYRTEDEISVLTFVDALYYSGITGTVLGYGDITPVSGWLKIAAFLQSGLGFALLTGIVTYLLNVVSSLTERNALSARLQSETGGTGDGIQFVVRSLALESGNDATRRLASLRESLHHLSEKMHQFPIVDLFYRSMDPARDPEPMIETLTQIALTAKLATGATKYQHIRPSADDFIHAVAQLLTLMANQHFDSRSLSQFATLKSQPEEQAYLAGVKQRLEELLAISIEDKRDDLLHSIAARARVFLQYLDKITSWRIDHPGR